MSNISNSEIVGTPLSPEKEQSKSPKSDQKLQLPTRDSNSPSLNKLNFASTTIDTANKTKKSPIIPSLTIQGRRSFSPQGSDSRNSTQSQQRIQMQDISPTSHRSTKNDSTDQQPPLQIDFSQSRSIVAAPPIPRLNFSGISRSCQSLNLNRAPIPPMNVAIGSRKTVSGFNINLPEEYSSKNVNRPVIICIPWTTVPTSAGADQANKNYNIDNNLRSENSYSHKSQKVQNLNINLNSNSTSSSNLNFDDAVLSDLINSTFFSNRIFSTPDVLPNTVIIEEDEVTSTSQCNSGGSQESSTNSPRSFHSAHNSLKLSRVNSGSNRNSSLASNSTKIDHPNHVYRTGSFTPNSSKSFNFLSTVPGVNPTVVSEVSSDSIPSLQAIDSAYQKVQHFPSLIEQTNSESTHLTTYIESVIAEIEICREEKEKLHIQNEIIRSNIRQAKEEIKILSQSQERMKRVIDALKQKDGSKGNQS